MDFWAHLFIQLDFYQLQFHLWCLRTAPLSILAVQLHRSFLYFLDCCTVSWFYKADCLLLLMLYLHRQPEVVCQTLLLFLYLFVPQHSGQPHTSHFQLWVLLFVLLVDGLSSSERISRSISGLRTLWFFSVQSWSLLTFNSLRGLIFLHFFRLWWRWQIGMLVFLVV